MLHTLLNIIWDINPELLNVDIFGKNIVIRWYGLLFACAFLFGQMIMAKIFKLEHKSEKDLETLSYYIIISTVIGARLGHCLFYQPEYYLSNPIEILKIWEGGLASHGAAVTIILAIYLYSRSHPDQSFFWVLDRIAIVTCLGGMFIRLGNLMNSEIIGKAANVPWAFVFVKAHIADPNTPRHPSQIYEAAFCLFLFLLLGWVYKRYHNKPPEGLIFGLFMALLFAFRFVIEFFKEIQVDKEATYTINLGQRLSIPAVTVGLIALYIVYRNQQKKKLQD